jgi:hypothetical protein
MDAGDLILKAHALGAPFTVDGFALAIPAKLPPTMKSEAVRLRAILAPLLSLSVARLCDGMTGDEREAFEERAAMLEADAGYPRELAERVALWWVRTPAAERVAA